MVKDAFEKRVPIEFRDLKLEVFSCYDTYLSNLYVVTIWKYRQKVNVKYQVLEHMRFNV